MTKEQIIEGKEVLNKIQNVEAILNMIEIYLITGIVLALIYAIANIVLIYIMEHFKPFDLDIFILPHARNDLAEILTVLLVVFTVSLAIIMLWPGFILGVTIYKIRKR